MQMHAHEEETLVVLEGLVDVTIDGATVQGCAGQNVRLPRQLPHRIANNCQEAARYVLVCSPSGFEAFIEQCAQAQTGPVRPTPPSPEQIARMRAYAGQFGIGAAACLSACPVLLRITNPYRAAIRYQALFPGFDEEFQNRRRITTAVTDTGSPSPVSYANTVRCRTERSRVAAYILITATHSAGQDNSSTARRTSP
jgi:hypothetical protein